MSDTILAAVVGGVCGLITGTIGSLIAPWIHWGIEKRRNRVERRRVIIDNTRLMLSGGILSRKDMRQEPAYAAIRSHLSPELVSNIGRGNTTGGEETIHKNIMRELSELEKQWTLV